MPYQSHLRGRNRIPKLVAGEEGASFGISLVRTPIYPDYATNSGEPSRVVASFGEEGCKNSTGISFIEIDSENVTLESVKASDGRYGVGSMLVLDPTYLGSNTLELESLDSGWRRGPRTSLGLVSLAMISNIYRTYKQGHGRNVAFLLLGCVLVLFLVYVSILL